MGIRRPGARVDFHGNGTAIFNLSDLESIVDPAALTGWDFVAAFVILATGYVLARWARRVAQRLVEQVEDVPENVMNLAGSLAFWSVFITALVLTLSVLGFDVAPAVLVFLIVAVMVVLSGRSLLENFGAGLILQVRSPFEAGQQITSNDYEGEVVEINGRTTVIRTMDGTLVHIPNGSVVANPIVNLSEEGRRRSRIDVGVEYGTDLELAGTVMMDAVSSIDLVFSEPAPEVLVTQFGDSAINFAVRFWHQPLIRAGFEATDAVARTIDTALKQHGIVIAFPQTTLWWGDTHNGE